MTEFEVGQKVYGEQYDRLPVGTKFRMQSWSGEMLSEWEVVEKGQFRYVDDTYFDWSVTDYEYERVITYLPEPKDTLRIEHTLVGAEVGDKVWPLNMPSSSSKWPATIEGLDVDLVNVITADGHLERIHPSSLTTTPIEPPVWSVVTTKTPATTASTFVHTDSGWRSLNGEWYTWTELCERSINGTPLLRSPE